MVAGTISAVQQYAATGKVDFGTTALAAGAGAISGGLAGSGVGLAGQIVLNAAIGASQSTIQQTMDNKGDISKVKLGDVAWSAGVGAVAGLFGGAGASSSALLATEKRLMNRLGSAFTNKSGAELKSEVAKAMVHFMKEAGTNMKSASDATVKAILKSAAPGVADMLKNADFKSIADQVNKMMEN